MEQRNYSNQNDIRPIEELISGKSSPPDLYASAFKTGNNADQQVQQAQSRVQTQPQTKIRKHAPQQQQPQKAPPSAEAQQQQPRFRPAPRTLSTEAKPGLFADDHMRAQRIKDKITPDKKITRKKLNLKSKAPLLWGSLGFLFGIAFWHTVGFWNFVEDAVLQKPETTKLSRSVLSKQTAAGGQGIVIVQDTPPVKKIVYRETITPSNVGSCVNLIMDRRTGKTRASRCQSGITFYKGQSPLRTTAFRTH